MQLTHNQFKKARGKIIGSIKRIQHFMRMYWFKQLFMKNLKVTKQRSTFLIQKYLKGYKVHSEYREIVHRAKIDKLQD